MKKFTKIINLTIHQSTATQAADGVFEPTDKQAIRQLLLFDKKPDRKEIQKRASILADIARMENPEAAMIGGAPFLMSALESALTFRGIIPVYAFSVRESIEEILPDGSIKKTNVFRHDGFVE